MKYLAAEKQTTQYFFRVHMDESKLIDNEPDPSYVVEYAWGLTPPGLQTEDEYLANIKTEISLLVDDTLNRMTPPPAPTPLAGF